MNKILLIAMMTIAGLAQAEPAQVTRGSIAELKFRTCLSADEFGDYAHTVQKRGGQYSDYLNSIHGSSALATAVGRYIFLEHGKERVFDACMRDPSLFRINL